MNRFDLRRIRTSTNSDFTVGAVAVRSMLTVLIIEDDHDSNEALVAALTEAGCSCIALGRRANRRVHPPLPEIEAVWIRVVSSGPRAQSPGVRSLQR
jgi:hypothetical protein